MIKTNFKQSHFVIYELQLPYCTTCTPAGDLTEAWHTPITCAESSDDVYSLWFTSNSAPIMQPPSTSISMKSKLNSKVSRCVATGSETTPTLKPGEGMASRGMMSVSMTDFNGDPGPINFSDSGTFFGKLLARNVLDGKKIITHYYTIINGNETPELVGSAQHFIENATLTGGRFTLTAKDALQKLEAFSQKFPAPSEVILTADVDETTTSIPVNDGSLFASGDVAIIDEELIRVQSVSGNTITSYTRGADYNGIDKLVYKTIAESHSVDSTVQKCYVMDKVFLSDVLQDIYIDADLAAYVDYTQWDDEIRQWNENAFLTGVFYEPSDSDDVINGLLIDYMIDMWLDQSTQKAVVSANTAWKQSIRTIVEGDDLSGLKTSTRANSRFSRAYIYNNKDYQSANDDTTNYSQLTLHKDVITESDDLYGTIKVKEFDPSPYITSDSAFILVSRYVQRFARTPKEISFNMEERKLANSRIGDIVDIVTRDSQTPSGEFLQSKVRAQLLEIKPKLNNIGRSYDVKALSYIPLIDSGGGALVIFISGTVFDVNLFARAGAPPNPIDITFIFDGAIVGSTSSAIPAIRAGNFDPASTIKMICINSTKISAIGGKGGDATVTSDNTDSTAATTNGTNGGDSYQSDGIATEIYLNYGVVDTYTTGGQFYAAGGGGGAASGSITSFNQAARADTSVAVAGAGGSGIPGGVAGNVSGYFASDANEPKIGKGNDGTFLNGGNGIQLIAYDTETFTSPGNPPISYQATVRSTGQSGSGGWSLNGGSSLILNELIDGSDTDNTTSSSSSGLAGGAIKGSGVIVYNLLADASKFRDGNSDPYTLITA